jgi:YggT family protein
MSAVITYVNALFIVFTIVILLRILLSFLTIVPVRRSTQAVYDFIIDSTEWYLRIFRRFIPPLGMFDLSPIVAFIVLGILQVLVTNILSGF